MTQKTDPHLSPDDRDAIARSIRELTGFAARSDRLPPDTLRKATDEIERVLARAGFKADGGLDDLPEQMTQALDRLNAATGADIAQLLRAFADLSEGGSDRPESLEDLAAWLERHIGPILSDEHGPEAETRRKQAYRDGARGVVDAALARRGIGKARPPHPAPRPPAADMSRHLIFWRNFSGLAPGLLRLAATPDGAGAAAAQVSDMLRALDLPHGATILSGRGRATLDFAAPDDAETALVLQRMLADAPVLTGWHFAVGGADT